MPALHPGAKAALLVALFVLTLALPLMPLLAATLAASLLALALAPRAATQRLSWGALFAGVNVALLGLAWGGPTVLWSAGPLAFTLEGAREGLAVSARVTLALLAAWAFVATTPPAHLVAALQRFPRAAVATASVLRFVPLLTEDFRTLRDAQRLRGRPLARGVRGALAAGPLAAPLVVRTVRRGHLLQDALHAAAFDPRARRESYAPAPWRAADSVVSLAALTPLVLLALWRLLQ